MEHCPLEVIYHIANCLLYTDVMTWAQTASEYRKVFKEDFWRSRYIQHYSRYPLPHNVTYQARVKELDYTLIKTYSRDVAICDYGLEIKLSHMPLSLDLAEKLYRRLLHYGRHRRHMYVMQMLFQHLYQCGVRWITKELHPCVAALLLHEPDKYQLTLTQIKLLTVLEHIRHDRAECLRAHEIEYCLYHVMRWDAIKVYHKFKDNFHHRNPGSREYHQLYAVEYDAQQILAALPLLRISGKQGILCLASYIEDVEPRYSNNTYKYIAQCLTRRGRRNLLSLYEFVGGQEYIDAFVQQLIPYITRKLPLNAVCKMFTRDVSPEDRVAHIRQLQQLFPLPTLYAMGIIPLLKYSRMRRPGEMEHYIKWLRTRPGTREQYDIALIPSDGINVHYPGYIVIIEYYESRRCHTLWSHSPPYYIPANTPSGISWYRASE